MRSEEEQGWGLSGVAFFIAGAMIGAVAAILYAPQAGDETRERLGGWIGERRERGRDVVQRLRERIPGRVRGKASEISESLQGEADRRT